MRNEVSFHQLQKTLEDYTTALNAAVGGHELMQANWDLKQAVNRQDINMIRRKKSRLLQELYALQKKESRKNDRFFQEKDEG